MKNKLLVSLLIAVALSAAGMAWAQSKTQTDKPDPRIDKLLEQNEQILKNQADILKKLESIEAGMTQLRRRSS